MKANRYRVLWLVVVSLMLVPSFAAADRESVSGVVEDYARLDFRGERLPPGGSAHLAALRTWSLEPTWAVIVVVKSYQVGQPRRAADGTRIDVNYEVLGELIGFRWTPRPALKNRSRTIFKLRQVETGWKISSPRTPPHVSLGAAISYLRKQTDPDSRQSLLALESLLARSAAAQPESD